MLRIMEAGKNGLDTEWCLKQSELIKIDNRMDFLM